MLSHRLMCLAQHFEQGVFQFLNGCEAFEAPVDDAVGVDDERPLGAGEVPFEHGGGYAGAGKVALNFVWVVEEVHVDEVRLTLVLVL